MTTSDPSDDPKVPGENDPDDAPDLPDDDDEDVNTPVGPE